MNADPLADRVNQVDFVRVLEFFNTHLAARSGQPATLNSPQSAPSEQPMSECRPLTAES